MRLLQPGSTNDNEGLKMIKTWEQRQAESVQEFNDMPLAKWHFMALEIADLRAALAVYESRSASDRAMHVDWDKYETDLMVQTLSMGTSPEAQAYYDELSRYASYLEAGGPGEPMEFEQWRALQ